MTVMPSATRPEVPRRVLWTILVLLCGLGSAAAQMGELEDLDRFPKVKLEITDGRQKRLEFDVWVAQTPARQAQGLMFVRSLPRLRGMLFVYDGPKHITMWMKNTYIPLDMVFIDERGAILEIAERTVPHSLDIIRSRKPARAVLEIAGGEARRLGLKPGQRVSYPEIPRD